jgi:predicted kinase
MELEAAQRPDLAAGVVARFAEASDDFGLYGVLDFYLSYRAWVRGKVAAFLAADAGAPADLRLRARDEARRRFGLARAAAGPPLDRPFLIAVGGVIGSGKSTLARALGRTLAVPVISSDRTRKRAAGMAPDAPGDPSLYEPRQREQTYATLVESAAEVLAAGRGVILDATFSARRWRDIAAATARANGAAFAFIEARCPRQVVLRQRLAARRDGPSESDADEGLLTAFLRDYEPVGSFDAGPRFGIDTSGTPETARNEALERLSLLGILSAAERRAS